MLGYELFQCENFFELQLQTIRHISGIVDINTGIFVLHPERTPRPKIVFYSVGDDLVKDSTEQLSPIDVDNSYANDIDKNYRVWKCSTSKPHPLLASLMETNFYQRNVPDTNMQHAMAIELISDNRHIGLIFLFRDTKGQNFSQAELKKAGEHVPIMEQALKCLLYKERSAHWARVANTLEAQLINEGLTIINQNWHIIYKNLHATELLNKLDRGNRRAPEEMEKIPDFFVPKEVSDLTTCDEEIDITSYIPRAPKELKVKVRLLQISDDFQIRRYLIRFKSHSLLNTSQNKLNKLEKLGLTSRQIEIVNAFATGLTTDEVADQLYITAHTVNSHLKCIYQRLGVHNRLALLHKINEDASLGEG